MCRGRFPAIRFFAVHTTSPISPRTLLVKEAENKGPLTGTSALRLPAGNSRQDPALDITQTVHPFARSTL